MKFNDPLSLLGIVLPTDPKQPFGLPEGTVRGTGFFGSLALTGFLMVSGITIPAWWPPILVLIVKYYFDVRNGKTSS